MIERIVSNIEEAEEIAATMDKDGYKLICMSNAGLSSGKSRLTFIEKSIKVEKEDDL